MKQVSEYANLRIPSYALPYLVNGDASGLEDSDVKAIDRYMSQYYEEAKSVSGHVIFSAGDGDSFFTRHPEFGLACDCVECSVLIVKS